MLDMPLTLERYNPGTLEFDDLTPRMNKGANNGADVGSKWSTFISANSDYVRIADTAALSPSSKMSVAAWVNGVPSGGKVIMAHYDTGTSQRSFMMAMSTGPPYNLLCVYISDDGTYTDHVKYYISSVAAFDSTPHLIGSAFDAGILKLYIDGVEDTNPTKAVDAAITSIHNSTADVTIGAYLNNDVPTASIDADIARPRIWGEKALSAAEFKLMYNQEKGLYL